ncbi:MAG: hypothetical protein KDJ19_11860 [Hyphomicrobiaceae bacterium]|nr:hypothetical protein [Hyphomicrobiaceae bacterium]MCC0024866.1 hypothetical protein [Hyphomicrobiaceae bacterium]
MNVSGVSGALPVRSIAPAEASEGPGPDKVNDHDADDVGAAPVQAATPSNVGRLVDISA